MIARLRLVFVAVVFATGLASVGALAPIGGSGSALAGVEDDAFLQSIAGNWRGNGRVRTRIDADRERVSCRLAAVWNEGSGRLTMDFDCRGVDFEFSSSGFVTSLVRDTYVEGQWRGTGRIGQANVSGRRNGRRLSLTLTSRDDRSGEEAISTLSIELSGAGELVNVIRVVDKETRQEYDALSLRLRR